MILNHKSQQILSASTKVTSEIISHTEEYFRKMAPAKKKILNKLIDYSSKYITVRPSQKTLGIQGKVTREYTNIVIKEFESLGVLNKRYRYKDTCIYKIHEIFNNFEFRNRLSGIFPALKLIPFIWMLSSQSVINDSCQSENITLVNCNLLFDCSSYSFINNKLTVYHTTKKNTRFIEILGWVKTKKEEVVMTANPISQSIRDITELKLTKWGQIKLMAFPDGAIEYTRRALNESNPKKITEPFRWFYKICLDYCNQNDIYPDYETAKELAQVYKMPLDPKFLDENKVYQSGSQKKRFEKQTDNPVVMSTMEKLFKLKKEPEYTISETKPKPLGEALEIFFTFKNSHQWHPAWSLRFNSEDEYIAEYAERLARDHKLTIEQALALLTPDKHDKPKQSVVLEKSGKDDIIFVRNNVFEATYETKKVQETKDNFNGNATVSTNVCPEFNTEWETSYEPSYENNGDFEEIYDPIEI